MWSCLQMHHIKEIDIYGDILIVYIISQCLYMSLYLQDKYHVKLIQ